MPIFPPHDLPSMDDERNMAQNAGFGPTMAPGAGFGPDMMQMGPGTDFGPEMQMTPGPGFAPGMVQGAVTGPAMSPTFGPVNVHPANVMPPVVSPTQQFVNTNQFTTIVPHIHPSHTTTVNKHKFIHEHYCPHTQSVVNEVSHQHVNCGCPRPMKPFCGC